MQTLASGVLHCPLFSFIVKLSLGLDQNNMCVCICVDSHSCEVIFIPGYQNKSRLSGQTVCGNLKSLPLLLLLLLPPSPAAMCPADLQQLWKDVAGVQNAEEAMKQGEGLDLSTNSSNSTSAFPKAMAQIPMHSLPNGQSHTPKRDRYAHSRNTLAHHAPSPPER